MSRIELEQAIVNREFWLSHSVSSMDAVNGLPENQYREEMTRLIANRIQNLNGDIEVLRRELLAAP